MPQPMEHYRIHVLNELDGKEKGSFLARFPAPPQVGWTLVFDNAGAVPRDFTDIEGVVTKVVMLVDCQEIQIYIEET